MGKCFVKGTLVHTKDGLKPIEEIKAGDEVLSYNEKTKQTEYKPVVETDVRQTEQLVKLQIANEAKAIETTPEHPFYVRIHRARDSISDDEGEWREAGSLQIGNEVLSASGSWEKVVAIEQQQRNETVYNFAVADNHNYFVGEKGALVHNVCSLLDDLSKAAALPDKGGYTAAGRSLTKHAAGARPGSTLFPPLKGNTQAINNMAQNIVDDILTTPGTVMNNAYRGRFGNTLEFTAPDGRGLVFDSINKFLFFKE